MQLGGQVSDALTAFRTQQSLTTERELAAKLHVSRGQVRQAKLYLQRVLETSNVI